MQYYKNSNNNEQDNIFKIWVLKIKYQVEGRGREGDFSAT